MASHHTDDDRPVAQTQERRVNEDRTEKRTGPATPPSEWPLVTHRDYRLALLGWAQWGKEEKRIDG